MLKFNTNYLFYVLRLLVGAGPEITPFAHTNEIVKATQKLINLNPIFLNLDKNNC